MSLIFPAKGNRHSQIRPKFQRRVRVDSRSWGIQRFSIGRGAFNQRTRVNPFTIVFVRVYTCVNVILHGVVFSARVLVGESQKISPIQVVIVTDNGRTDRRRTDVGRVLSRVVWFCPDCKGCEVVCRLLLQKLCCSSLVRVAGRIKGIFPFELFYRARDSYGESSVMSTTDMHPSE